MTHLQITWGLHRIYTFETIWQTFQMFILHSIELNYREWQKKREDPRMGILAADIDFSYRRHTIARFILNSSRTKLTAHREIINLYAASLYILHTRFVILSYDE